MKGEETVKEIIIPDDTLDVVGLYCPMPLALTMERIDEMKIGKILAVLLDDEEAVLDIPKWCKKDGHRFMRLEKEGEIYKLYIKKGGVNEYTSTTNRG